ncbi:MAG: hypothetical protein ACK5LJ_09205 [Paracoccus sp. (in: a-proteobacteria)]
MMLRTGKVRARDGRSCWAVVDGDGNRVSGIFNSHDEAKDRLQHLQEEARRKSATRERPCMRCRQVFESEGIHNRLCRQCLVYAARVNW